MSISVLSGRVGSGHITPTARVALWALVGLGGMVSAILLVAEPLLALAVPVVLIAGLVTSRFPVATVVGIFFLTGFFGSIASFLGVTAPPAIDVLLGGLWLGTAWSYLFSGRQRPVWLWPGVIFAFVYIAITSVQALASPDLVLALRDFRVSAWYMLGFVLVAFSPWAASPAGRARIARGFVTVALLVGTYAVFRWLVGPSATEQAYTLSQSRNEVLNGQTRLYGSLLTGKQLAAWTSAAIPFCLAFALAARSWWRVVGLTACAACAVALFGSDVRAGVVAVVPAVALVLLMYQLAVGFPGLHLGGTLTAGLVITLIGAGAFAITLGGKNTTPARYKGLVTAPTADRSYQARVLKWRTALKGADKHPLGRGLGTASGVQKRFGRFLTISNYDLDNSYVKIAIEQGYPVLGLFLASLLALGYGLARRGMLTRDAQAAALAIGALGTLTALAIVVASGPYLETITVLPAWLMVGLGVAPFVWSAPTVGRRQPSRSLPIRYEEPELAYE